jgi:GT2 family glycosyltransferase
MSTAERTAGPSRDFEGWDWRPNFSILLYSTADSTREQTDRSRRSIKEQIYPFRRQISCSSDALPAAIAEAEGDYVLPLRAGDALSQTALLRLAERLQTDQWASILYGDHDEIDERGRRVRPWFKPQWNEEMFLAQDFLSPCVAIETGIARSANATTLSDLLLAATSLAEGRILHVPHVLCHLDPAGSRCDSARLADVARYLEPLAATTELGSFDTVKVNWPLPAEHPLVSIIIPTRDCAGLLRACVDSVLAKTSYEPYEVLVVDNGSVEPEALNYLSEIARHPNVRVLRYDQPYNFSAINNFASREAQGTFLCLLNNDTEVVAPDWLTEMMRQAVRPGVGAVGAKLLYDDGSIQHAGIVVGMGDAAGHPHRFLAAEDPGYFRQPHVSQFVSAVTAACLVIDKAKYEAVGGLDEENLAVAYNDVDLGLKLQAAGWRNVYVPHAVLLHHESKSRGSDMAPENRERYSRELRFLQERWATKTYEDPLHNPNLDRSSETYVIRI